MITDASQWKPGRWPHFQPREFAGLRLRFGQRDASPQVVDRDRRKSHADITASLSVCCHRVAVQQLRGTTPSFASMAGKASVRVARGPIGSPRKDWYG